MMALVILGTAGRVRGGVACADGGGNLESSRAAGTGLPALAGLPSCLVSWTLGSGGAAGVSADGGRGQRRAGAAGGFWAGCRVRAPIAAAVPGHGPPPSPAPPIKARSLPSGAGPRRRG